ncbi:antibiotic biosynthesis monooxygenase family protein [Rummeliibacillus pycnus]|uniref:antibiotic biosynthesis monooxygenase family protein n=1 Tax=Rummeliibacillus pycnus TaxID=101070 RepID=UPI0037C5DE29
MNVIVKTQEPPYYAVIFTSQRTEADNGYAEMAKRMEELATKQEGFLGIESARDNELGITVSYWNSLEAIKNWKNNASHQIAQKRGKEEWYQNYHVRISKVERDYFID